MDIAVDILLALGGAAEELQRGCSIHCRSRSDDLQGFGGIRSNARQGENRHASEHMLAELALLALGR